MNAREAAARAAILKTLYDQVKAAFTAAKADVMDHLDPGDRKHAVLDNGGDLGTVSVSIGRASAAVHDETAFLKWVRENRPDEIVETVRPSFRAHILKIAADTGAPVVNDDGEYVDGIEVRTGEPYVSVRQTADQRDAVLEAYDAGHLHALLRGTPLEIEGGS